MVYSDTYAPSANFAHFFVVHLCCYCNVEGDLEAAEDEKACTYSTYACSATNHRTVARALGKKWLPPYVKFMPDTPSSYGVRKICSKRFQYAQVDLTDQQTDFSVSLARDASQGCKLDRNFYVSELRCPHRIVARNGIASYIEDGNSKPS